MNGKVFITPQIKELIGLGALFVINDSGGKDSQCMKRHLMWNIPHHQLVIVHAHLPEVEWEGTFDHVKRYSEKIPTFEVRAKKTFFEMVMHRRKFPDAARRQCTSDLKRGPIQKFINNYCKENHFNTVVNCMGLRAEESPARSKKEVFQFREDLSCKHRNQYEWLPIHHFTIHEVWNTIKLSGQKRHWAYDEGMTRLSCCFCIMASQKDLKTSAALNPELYKRYVDTEKELGFTLSMSRKPLMELTR